MTDRLFRRTVEAAGFPLVDVHAHVGVSDEAGLSVGRLSGDEYTRLMEASGIACACVFSPTRRSYRAANAALAAWAASTGGRILPFARLGGPRGPAPVRSLWQVRRRLRALLAARPADVDDLGPYAGVKLMPHLCGLPNDDVLARVSERRMPVLIHAGTHCPPAWIERVLLPRLRGPVILAHLGAFPCDGRLLEDAVRLARREERVYLDTSGAWLAGFVRHAAARVPHKLLFGSDAPLMHPGVAWRHVATSVRDDGILEGIGRRNAEAVFGRRLRTP